METIVESASLDSTVVTVPAVDGAPDPLQTRGVGVGVAAIKPAATARTSAMLIDKDSYSYLNAEMLLTVLRRLSSVAPPKCGQLIAFSVSDGLYIWSG